MIPAEDNHVFIQEQHEVYYVTLQGENRTFCPSWWLRASEVISDAHEFFVNHVMHI